MRSGRAYAWQRLLSMRVYYVMIDRARYGVRRGAAERRAEVRDVCFADVYYACRKLRYLPPPLFRRRLMLYVSTGC